MSRVKFGDGSRLKRIEKGAFSGCRACLKDMKIPTGVEVSDDE